MAADFETQRTIGGFDIQIDLNLLARLRVDGVANGRFDGFCGRE